MKIKDVITETNLTDRAIRLYIENGLVSPSCSENYAGRKNIDFTEDDVETLKNIATLRKAGFSIAQIKELFSDITKAPDIVSNMIGDLSEKVKSDSETVERLKLVLEKEKIDVTTICNALNNFIADKAVPEEDTNLTPAEKAEKFIFTFLAAIALSLVAVAALYCVLCAHFNYGFLYPTLRVDLYAFLKFLVYFLAIVISIYIIHKYKHIKRNECVHKRRTRSFFICVFLAFLVWVCGYTSIITLMYPDFYSKTTDPADYMITDGIGDYVKDFMPKSIPYNAREDHELSIFLDLPDTYPKTTKYYYKHYRSDFLDDEGFYEIIAEWKLPDDNSFGSSIYEKEKKKYLNDMGEITATKTKGDWQCLYYKDTEEENWSTRYYYTIFAYNDETSTVRYIVTYHYYDFNADESIKFSPRYLNLEW